jgi:poly-beta-1,6-N-acetyl-D-glucosamine biosynthesis protein PgaD
MKNERSRHILESKKNLPLIVVIRDIILTIFVWALYLYFMRDFFTFGGDVIHWTFHGFSDSDEYYSFRILSTIISYFEIIIIMEVLFVVWSMYNLLRYGKKKRRSTQPAVKKEELAKAFHVSLEDVGAWQKAQTMVMHHDKRGRLIEVQTS